jgi:hypothetical protein
VGVASEFGHFRVSWAAQARPDLEIDRSLLRMRNAVAHARPSQRVSE